MRSDTALDKIQTIEHSLRCYVCGLLGLVPLLGFPFGLFALLDFRRVVLGRAGQWNPARRYLLSGFWLGGIGVLNSLLLFGTLLYAACTGELFS